MVDCQPTPPIVPPKNLPLCMWIDERRRKVIAKIHANLVFQTCISFWGCFRKALQSRDPSVYWIATLSCTCLVPQWLQNMQICILFRSGSDLWRFLGLSWNPRDAVISYLVSQACISLCSILDKNGARLFWPCSQEGGMGWFWGAGGGRACGNLWNRGFPNPGLRNLRYPDVAAMSWSAMVQTTAIQGMLAQW